MKSTKHTESNLMTLAKEVNWPNEFISHYEETETHLFVTFKTGLKFSARLNKNGQIKKGSVRKDS